MNITSARQHVPSDHPAAKAYGLEAVRILRIGSTQPVNAAGCIVNPCSAERVYGPWRDAVDALVAGCRAAFGTALHSVHLRGSVPRGLAVDGVSDLDAIAIVESARPVSMAWRTALEQRVRHAHPGCRGVDLRVWPLQVLTRLPARHPARFTLKTQGLCVWGHDPATAWPPVPLSEARTGLNALPPALARMRDALLQAHRSDAELMRRRCRWLAKKIVRAGFELVAQQEQAYTRDLFPCWEAFARHHPAHATAMQQVLAMAVEPSSEPDQIRAAMALGTWLLAEDARSDEGRGAGTGAEPASIGKSGT